MTGTGLPIALIGILMALWLVGATVALWIGLSMRSKSNKMLRQTTRLARLLETAPARRYFPPAFRGRAGNHNYHGITSQMIIATNADMRAFGQKLAQELERSDWVAINGPLGAGKTVLCAGILAGLGFEGEVASPSYAIVHSYEPPEVSIAVAHVDLYRLENADELDELGLADERTDRITLVEWAERFGPAYVVPSHTIDIWPQADGTRILTLKMDKNDTRN